MSRFLIVYAISLTSHCPDVSRNLTLSIKYVVQGDINYILLRTNAKRNKICKAYLKNVKTNGKNHTSSKTFCN